MTTDSIVFAGFFVGFVFVGFEVGGDDSLGHRLRGICCRASSRTTKANFLIERDFK